MNQFGEFLKKSRINAGLTQEQLAEKMSVSLTSVQKWESGTSQIRNDKLSNLAYYLNIPTDIIIKEMTHIEHQNDLSEKIHLNGKATLDILNVPLKK